MNNQNNQHTGFQDSSYDPFDPFGLGNSSGFSSTSSTGGTTQSDPAATQTQSNPVVTPEPAQNTDTKPEPAQQTQSSGDNDGITVKTVQADDQAEEEKEDKTPANFQIGSKITEIKIPLKKHNLNFDENYFIKLLAGSISLGRDEKKRILDTIPTLRQAQIDQLIEIFEDEKRKFAELPEKHIKELKKLDEKHTLEWMSIEDEYLQDVKKQEEEAQADEIRKKLGL